MADQANIIDSEEWRDVPGWEGTYSISSFGRVRSLARSYRAMRKGVLAKIPVSERILKQFLTAGYPSVALCQGGTQKTVYVHEIVCAAWHGPRPLGKCVAHNDGNKENSRPENLRWATQTENMADKATHGTQLRGNDLWFTKIPDEAVPIIRRNEKISVEQWARIFGVSRYAIDSIKQGRRRTHV